MERLIIFYGHNLRQNAVLPSTCYIRLYFLFYTYEPLIYLLFIYDCWLYRVTLIFPAFLVRLRTFSPSRNNRYIEYSQLLPASTAPTGYSE